jgi:hypothetical protein
VTERQERTSEELHAAWRSVHKDDRIVVMIKAHNGKRVHLMVESAHELVDALDLARELAELDLASVRLACSFGHPAFRGGASRGTGRHLRSRPRPGVAGRSSKGAS